MQYMTVDWILYWRRENAREDVIGPIDKTEIQMAELLKRHKLNEADYCDKKKPWYIQPPLKELKKIVCVCVCVCLYTDRYRLNFKNIIILCCKF